MEVTASSIKKLRGQCGAGIMDCRKALLETKGDLEKALEILKRQSLIKAEKKAERSATEGIIEAYIHAGGRVGAMVEVNCETDFTARTEEFRELAHNLAMQITAMSPEFISSEDIHERADIDPQTACLLLQPYIKDTDKTIKDIITETIARVGENIKVNRFARFELGR